MFEELYIEELRVAINSSPLFLKDENYRERYNLTCAVMDRLEMSIRYLKQKMTKPQTEEDFLCFMMFACMVVDASKELLKTYDISVQPEDEYHFFKHTYIRKPLELREDQYPTDDKFFEYFRSLTFAHPFDTSRAKFIPKGQKQYSPWVLVNDNIGLSDLKNAVGVRVYCNNRTDVMHLFVSFDDLLEYVHSRYIRIALISSWLTEEVSSKNAEWNANELLLSTNDIDNLRNIKAEMERRYMDSSSVEDLLEYMTCACSYEENRNIVEKYRKEIHDAIPSIITALKQGDEPLISRINSLLYKIPRNPHPRCCYQLEKIFCYLVNDEGRYDGELGLKMAEEFADEFAKKWVVIKPREMSFEEIKMLVTIACREETTDQIRMSESH